MRNDVKQNADAMGRAPVRPFPRVAGLAMMLGVLAASGGPVAMASGNERGNKIADADTGPWPLCSGESNSKALAEGNQVLGLYEMGDGTYLLHTVDAVDAKSCVKSTTANLKFQFEGASAAAIIADSIPSGTPIVYDFSSPPYTLAARVTEPVICHGYYSGTDKLALALTDSNGTEQVLRGVETVNYQTSIGTLVPVFAQAEHGPQARCHVFPYQATITNPPATPDPDTSDALFAAGFESTGDLEVTLLAEDGSPLQIGHITTAVGTEFRYKVRVRNPGEGSAIGVQVREFLPAPTGTVTPAITANSCSGLRNTVPSPTPVSCAGMLNVALGTLAAGDSVEFTLGRIIPTGAVGIRALTAVAAFSDPSGSGDPDLSNNARALVVEIVDQIQVTRGVTTNGASGGIGGTISRVSVPAGCSAEAGAVTTCPPATTGLVYSAVAANNYTFTGFSGCAGTPSGVSAAGGTYTTTGGTTCSVVANFFAEPVVTATAGANGSISPPSQQVDYDSHAEFTITPVLGHQVVLPINGCGGVEYDAGSNTWSTVNPVTANCAVAVTFAPKQSTVTATAGPNGAITSQNPVTVTYPIQQAVFTVMADATYEAQVAGTTTCQTINGPYPNPFGPGVMFAAEDVLDDCQIDFTFSLITHPVSVSPNLTNGSLVLDSPTVVHGENAGFTVVPATGYHLDGAVTNTGTSGACGTISLAGSTGTAGPITSAGCELSANFAINEYTVTVQLAASEDGTKGTIGEVGDVAGDVQPVLLENIIHAQQAAFAIFPVSGFGPNVVSSDPVRCNFQFSLNDSSLPEKLVYKANSVQDDCTVTVSFTP